MGRLLKKKDGVKQKKKKKNGDAEPESVLSDDTASKSESAVVKSLPQKKTIPAAKTAPAKGEKNFLEKSIQFLREVKVELKKVTWPSRKQTVGSTVVVILVVTIISMLLGLMDIGLSSVVKIVL